MPSSPADSAPAQDDDFDDDLEFCVECGDEFHYDDCGGYNPPCVCGAHCRRCHELEMIAETFEDDDADLCEHGHTGDEYCSHCDGNDDEL